MPASIVGIAQGADGTFARFQVTASYTPAAGATLVVFVLSNPGEIGNLRITDGGVGNTYAAASPNAYIVDTNVRSANALFAFVAQGVSGVPTVFRADGIGTDITAIAVVELTDVGALLSTDGHNSSSPGIGTDTVTTGLIGIASRLAYLVSLSVNINAFYAGAHNGPAAGTGMSGTAIFPTGSSGQNTVMVAGKRVSASAAGTFNSDSTNRFEDFLSFGLIFAEQGGADLTGGSSTRWSVEADLTTAPLATFSATSAARARPPAAAFTIGVLFSAVAAGSGGTSGAPLVQPDLGTGQPAALTGVSASKSTTQAKLTNFAKVTLVAPLYTGPGGILDPNFWADVQPAPGNVVYYDPTFITVASNGEIIATANPCQAVVQFESTAAGFRTGTVFFTTGFVVYARGKDSASASALATAVGWKPTVAISSKASVSASLTVSARFAAVCSGKTTVSAALKTAGANPFQPVASRVLWSVGASLTTKPKLSQLWTWDSITVTFDSLVDTFDGYQPGSGTGTSGNIGDPDGWTWDSTKVTFDAIFYTFDGATPWAAGAGVNVSNVTSIGAFVTWIAATNPKVIGYVLRLTPSGAIPFFVDTQSPAPNWVLANLLSGTTYLLEVAAYDADGDISDFAPATFTFTTLGSITVPIGAKRMSSPQYVFGPGIGWITPLTDASGAAIAVSAPILVAGMQDINIDMSAEVKELYGSGSMAVAIGRGKQKMGAKIKNAQVHGALWNNLFFGQTLSSSIYSAVYDAVGTVLTTTTVTPTVPGSGTFGYNLGVRDTNNIPLQRVASGPTAGQYSVASGVYTFSAADVSASKQVYIDFQYTGTSTTQKTLLLNNVPMGNAPTFQFDLIIPFQGNTFMATFFQCMSTKAGIATKLDDFAMPEFDFSAFAPGATAIGRLAWSQ